MTGCRVLVGAAPVPGDPPAGYVEASSRVVPASDGRLDLPEAEETVAVRPGVYRVRTFRRPGRKRGRIGTGIVTGAFLLVPLLVLSGLVGYETRSATGDLRRIVVWLATALLAVGLLVAETAGRRRRPPPGAPRTLVHVEPVEVP